MWGSETKKRLIAGVDPFKPPTSTLFMRLTRSIRFSTFEVGKPPPLRQFGSLIRPSVSCSRRWNSSALSRNEKWPHVIPSIGIANLTPLRGLLALHGPDAAKFLQGLITKTFPSEKEPAGMFTSFLSPQVSVPVSLIDSRDEFFLTPLYIPLRCPLRA